jgi:hypothetical protein
MYDTYYFIIIYFLHFLHFDAGEDRIKADEFRIFLIPISTVLVKLALKFSEYPLGTSETIITNVLKCKPGEPQSLSGQHEVNKLLRFIPPPSPVVFPRTL